MAREGCRRPCIVDLGSFSSDSVNHVPNVSSWLPTRYAFA
jgi:hypothetical protein